MPKVPDCTRELSSRIGQAAWSRPSRPPDESGSAACQRLGPRLSVKPITWYGWVKSRRLRKENREPARANDILPAAASFFGAAHDRRSKN